MATRPKVFPSGTASCSQGSSGRRVKKGRCRATGRGRTDKSNLASGRSCRVVRESPEREQIITHPMGMTLLRKLKTLPPGEVAYRLHAERVPLENLLDTTIPDDRMTLLVDALGKACSIRPTPETVRQLLFLLNEKRFVDGNVLGKWIATWTLHDIPAATHEENFDSTLLLLSQMQLVVPNSVSSISVILLILKGAVKDFNEMKVPISVETTSKLSEISEKNSKLLTERQEISSLKKKRRDNSKDTPPDDFRDISILPHPDELKWDYKPFLRSNIVNGQYENVHHYLDIHFRLLREDFIQPLREGIAEYTAEIADGNPDMENTGFQNFRLYNKVHTVEMKPIHGGVAYVLQFNVDDILRRVKWELSKRLIYGALVCLSKDQFKTLIFGVVVGRDPEDLKEGKVEVAFKVEKEVSQELLSCTFQMAESSSYFEAYRHVLRCLQTIDQTSFPFSQYFVSVCKDPQHPQYIDNETGITFDLSGVRNDKIETESLTRERCLKLQALNKVRVNEVRGWPEAELLGFDESQMEAYKAALREEVCLIQGPPGTGKTYVGLKIVQTLLKNKQIWGKDTPLLVVCYTNHALDQFLEGILDQGMTKVVRIGGRSSSERLKELNINKIRRSTKSTRKHFKVVREQLETCAIQIQQTKDMIKSTRGKLLKRHALEHVMTRDHCRSFDRFSSSHQQDVMLVWLCRVSEGECLKCPYPPKLCNSEQTVIRKVVDMEANVPKMGQNHMYNDSGIAYDDELYQRYLDDEDDFLVNIKWCKRDSLEEITINIDDYSNDMGPGNWHKARRRKPGGLQKFIERKLSESEMMTEEEACKIRNVWSLNEKQRWRLYRWWIRLFINEKNERLRTMFADYERYSNEFEKVRRRENYFKLRAHSVIGVTTTGAAKYNQLLREVGPPIIIIEEAAEILEAHVITSLSANCQHLILIGDHQQLRPNPTVYNLCKDYKLDVSLFERLIRNGMPCHRLSLQHRMRPEISHLLKVHKDFYPDLSDHKTVQAYDHIKGIEKDVYFVEHDCKEHQDGDSRSHSNLHEATFLMALCEYLFKQGYSTDQITVLTAYRGQARLLRQRIDKRVHICPIDNFQGEENDIILISFVRSNEEGKIGFLKVSNRVCVALSRAKKGLYCIGNFKLLSKQSEIWKTITADLRERGLIGPSLKLVCRNHPHTFADVSCSRDFRLVPEGGCMKRCATRLNCGHTCQKNCHPEDKEHRNIKCTKQCMKIMCAMQHRCPLKCYQPCDRKCQIEVTKSLPCLHKQKVACFMDPLDVKCQSKCSRRLKCGHQCKEICSDPCTLSCKEQVEKHFEPCGHKENVSCFQTKCPKRCTSLLKCGHVCQGTCGECENGRLHVQCREICKRILVCGHTCESKCSMSCPPCSKPCENRCRHNKCEKTCGENCVPCKEDCTWRCKHFTCSEKCGDICDRKPCDARCRLRLKCRHPCIGLCGEPCPQLCRVCQKEDVTRILFGNEDEPSARFVLLKDCSHIVEVTAMDRLMENFRNENEIKLPVCPWCKTPIRYNTRYNTKLHEIRRDIELVKEKIKGDQRTLKSKSSVLQRYVKEQSVMKIISKEVRWVEMLSKMDKYLSNSYTLSLDGINKLEIQLDMYKKLNSLKRACSALSGSLDENVDQGKELGPFKSFMSFLQERTSNFHFVSQQEVEDWQREYNRCKHSLSVVEIQDKMIKCEFEIADLEGKQTTLKEVKMLLSDGERFDEEKESKVDCLLKTIKKDIPLQIIGITEKERDTIVKAVKLSRAHWFKCPKGHVYAIDGCTGAMERSICTGCQASIGGERHRLDEFNAPAPEMYDNLWISEGKDS